MNDAPSTKSDAKRRGYRVPRKGSTDLDETSTNERCTCDKATDGSPDHEHPCPLSSVNPRALIISAISFQVLLHVSEAAQTAAMTPLCALHRWRAATGMPTAIQAPLSTPGLRARVSAWGRIASGSRARRWRLRWTTGGAAGRPPGPGPGWGRAGGGWNPIQRPPLHTSTLFNYRIDSLLFTCLRCLMDDAVDAKVLWRRQQLKISAQKTRDKKKTSGDREGSSPRGAPCGQ
jgi:hypothetical protein